MLSKCLFADADLLLLDEPTRGVDVGAKTEIYDIIRNLAEDGHVGRGLLVGARGGAGHLRPHLPAVRRLARGDRPERPGRGHRADPGCGDRRRREPWPRDGSGAGAPATTLLGQQRLSDEAFITILVGVVAIGLFLVASILVPNFFQPLNMLNLVTNNWAVIALGVGVTFLLVSGHFDLSVGGIVALSGVLAVWFSQSTGGANALSTGLGLPYWLAIGLALGGALAVGALNALFVVRFRIPSIIVTLGTMMLARGIAQVITQGSQRNTNLPDDFGLLGNLTMFGTSIKLPVVLMVVLVGIALFIERKTVFGRLTYRIGANPVAARLSGVDSARHLTALYLFSAGIAGSVGILLASEFKSGLSSRGTLMEFDALVIALLGGVAIAGGFGSVLGMFFGALTLAIVTSAATGLMLSPDWQFILKAVAVFLAIMTQTWALARRNR